AGVYDPKRVLGVTTLDVVRACAFIGEINGVDPRSVTIPVIGGHSGVTIIPLLSQSNPPVKLNDQAKIKALTERIQEAGTEVVKAKAGGGSATLSMAFAGARLTDAVLRGLKICPGSPSQYASDISMLEEREEFWADMRDVLVKCDRNERIIMLGDINGSVGVQQDRYEKVLSKFGDERVNDNEMPRGGGSIVPSLLYRLFHKCWKSLRVPNDCCKSVIILLYGKAQQGDANVVECAYVKSDVTEAQYFATPVVLGKNGVEKNLGYGKLNEFEQGLLKAAIPELLKNIKTGEDFAKK
ncbi:Malate dehydrogenase, glyoxysomal, partial [Eumeta japonica]